jgi:hypothetical protein
MQDQLARIYEKRLGSKSSMRPITGDDVMSIPINVLLRSTKGASDLSKKQFRRQGDRSWKKYLDASNVSGNTSNLFDMANQVSQVQCLTEIIYTLEPAINIPYPCRRVHANQRKDDPVLSVKLKMNDERFGLILLVRTFQG